MGLTLALAALTSYRSYAHRSIAGRWSVAYAVLLGAFAALWLLGVARLVGAWRSRRVRARGPALCADGSLLAWGIAYAVGTGSGAASAGRLADLIALGAVQPAAAALEWLAACLAIAGAAWAVLPRLGARAANLALAATALAGALAVLEGLARARAFAFPGIEGFPTYSGRVWGARHVRYSREGFRDRDHELASAPGVRRLLIVGDSYAFGAGVADIRDRFGEVLAGRLAAETHVPWEPISAALPDRHTLQEFELLERGLRYHPHVVILVYTFNDVDYLVEVTQRGDPVSRAPRSIAARAHPLRVLYYNSYLFQALYVRVRAAVLARDRAPRGLWAYADSAVMARHMADLRRFVAAASRDGAVVGIVPQDVGVSAGSPFVERYRGFVDRCRAAGLPVWPVDGAFLGHRLDELSVNALDRHPNARAHRLAAEQVLPVVLRAL